MKLPKLNKKTVLIGAGAIAALMLLRKIGSASSSSSSDGLSATNAAMKLNIITPSSTLGSLG